MKIILNDDSFRYDIHSLVKSFYPEEELNYDIISCQPINNKVEIAFDGNLRVIIPQNISKDRLKAKNIFKKQIYEILSRECKKELPWGTLTGVRPIKIPTELLNNGYTIEAVRKELKETYYISDKKSELVRNIAVLQRDILLNIDLKSTASLYVSIPFCPTICAYCSFSSYPIGIYSEKVEAYLEALKDEIGFIAENLRDKKIVTIYIGGGTPSTLSAEQLRDLVDFIKSKFDLSDLREISVECGRPDTIDLDKMQALKESGVGRISINPQSMVESTLKSIGRAHSTEDIYRAFDCARRAEIPIVNMDLIAGLPGEGEKEIKYTLNKIKELAPENLTFHSLAVKRASRIGMGEKLGPMEHSENIMENFYSFAEDLGMIPYYLYRQKQISANLENTGFAIPGLECLYNILIMGEYHDILAAGAGAVTKLTGEGKSARLANVKDVDLYIKRIQEMKERKLNGFKEKTS